MVFVRNACGIGVIVATALFVWLAIRPEVSSSAMVSPDGRPLLVAPTATPTPQKTLAPRPTPVATPTPSATPQPTKTAVPLRSLPAVLSIPAAGIQEAPITAFDESRDLKTVVTYDEYGNESSPFQAIEPPEMGSVIWYNRMGDGTLTSDAKSTSRLYCHANTEENPGVCQYIARLRAGDELIVDTPTETLTYTAVEPSPVAVPKAGAQEDRAFKSESPQTIRVITCNRSGVIGANGHAYENLYMTFALVSAKTK